MQYIGKAANMLTFTKLAGLLLFSLQAVSGLARDPKPYAAALHARQSSSGNSSSLQVDLGYEVYNGYSNATSGLNIWKG